MEQDNRNHVRTLRGEAAGNTECTVGLHHW